MNELEPHLKLDKQNTIELNVKKKQGIEYVLQGAIKPKSGHFIWEINEETGVVSKAEFKTNQVALYGAKLPPKELIVKSDCIYIPALNAQNAKKKYLKDNSQSSYYVKDAIMNFSEFPI